MFDMACVVFLNVCFGWYEEEKAKGGRTRWGPQQQTALPPRYAMVAWARVE